MILVVAHCGDTTAIGISSALCSRLGARRARLVSIEELVMAPAWSHALDANGSLSSIRLADGTTIDSRDLQLVFQRFRHVPMPHFANAEASDREYATSEMHALLLSWLQSLQCPVVNRPQPHSIGGPRHSLFAWYLLAARAGLEVPRVRLTTAARARAHQRYVPFSSNRDALPSLAAQDSLAAIGRGPAMHFEPLSTPYRSVLVIGEKVVGRPPDTTEGACVRLAELSAASILHLTFARSPRGWKFVGATPLPECEDADALQAVADYLCEQSRGIR